MNEEEKIEEQLTDNSSKPTENNDIISEPATINLSTGQAGDQPTTNMEVHKHAHHVTHKKKWGEYLLEFLMLFLAVFLGFVAENIREQSVERHREKEYMESLVQDLKRDTVNLSRIMNIYEIQIAKQDSLLMYIDSIKPGYNKNFMRYLQSVMSFPDFIYSDGTIQQLKSSGGFRLIRNKTVVDSINAYTAEIGKALLNTSDLGSQMRELDNLRTGFINYQNIRNAKKRGMTEDEMQKVKLEMLITHDEIKLSTFYNKALDFQTTQKIILKKNFASVKGSAGRLIGLIQKEYRLKE